VDSTNRITTLVCRCDMSKVGVVDRAGIIEMLVPESSKRYELFWDRHHFKTAEPYHAMNWDLINQLTQQKPVDASSDTKDTT
jgi:hypothetical protein